MQPQQQVIESDRKGVARRWKWKKCGERTATGARINRGFERTSGSSSTSAIRVSGRTVFFPAGRDSTPTASTTTTTGDGGALYSATAVAAALNNVDQPSRATSLSNVHSLLPTGDRDYEKTTTTAVGGRPGLVRGGAEARTLFIYSSLLFLSSLFSTPRLCTPSTVRDYGRHSRRIRRRTHTARHRQSQPTTAYRHRHPLIHGTTATFTQRVTILTSSATFTPTSSLAIAARHDFTTKSTKAQIK